MDVLIPLIAALGFVIAAVVISTARGHDELERVTRENATDEASRTGTQARP